MSSQAGVVWGDWKANLGLLLGRLMIVGGLIPNGMRKIATFHDTAAMMGGATVIMNGKPYPQQPPLFSFPFPEFFLTCSIGFDIVVSTLVLIGLRARISALALAFYVSLAIAIYHGPMQTAEDVQHVIRSLPFIGGLIVLAAAGAGDWSVDGWLKRRKSAG